MVNIHGQIKCIDKEEYYMETYLFLKINTFSSLGCILTNDPVYICGYVHAYTHAQLFKIQIYFLF